MTGILAGCDEPVGDRPVRSKPTVSRPDDPVAPELPALAAQHSKPGIRAVTRYFIETINHALKTGSLQPLQEISLPRCQSCSALARNIDAVYGRGGSITTAGWSIEQIQILGIDPNSQRTVVVELTVMQHPMRIIRSPGGEPTPAKRVRRAFTLYLAQPSSGWLVKRFDLVQS